MKLFRKEEGFTLVELMVVVLIIGILVAIAIPVFNAAKSNAQKKSCLANQRTIEGSAQTYAADNDGSMPANVAALVPTYIKTAPTCPRPNSSAAAGYSLNTSGTVANCTGGDGTAADHGHF
jgi:prepilin-type N-terminal cleavage/methylation domain-containing protein